MKVTIGKLTAKTKKKCIFIYQLKIWQLDAYGCTGHSHNKRIKNVL